MFAPHKGWPGLGLPWLQEPLRGCRQPAEHSRGRTLPELFHQLRSPARPSQHIPKNSPAKQAFDYQEIRESKAPANTSPIKTNCCRLLPHFSNASAQKTPRELGEPGTFQRGKSLQKEEKAQQSGLNSGHFIPTLERNHCRDLSSLGLSGQHELMQNLCATSSLQEEFATPRRVLRAGLLQTSHILRGTALTQALN